MLILPALVTPQTADAQSTGKVYRVGFLSSGSAAAQTALTAAFRDGMRERGWVEGKNFVVDYRFSENRPERLAGMASELIGAKVDLIVATPAVAAVAAKKATTTIPIVITSTADPVALGLVASLGRPGGNVTGLATGTSDIYGKRLQLLKEAIPNARLVAVLSNPGSATQPAAVSSVKEAARTLAVSLQPLEVRSPGDFEAAFAAMTKERADALLVVADPLFGTHASRLADLASKYRLPSIYGTRGEFEPGGLILYGPNGIYQVRQAAGYVDKILKGAKPADLPVEQPTKFELIINLKTAKALGITIPQSLLLRADEVIQ
jgi:putative ABC transport system substrate-binding protein